jgi:hypothetical protein
MLLVALLGAATLAGCGSSEEGAAGAQPNAGEARELAESHAGEGPGEALTEHPQEAEEAAGEHGGEVGEEQGETEGKEETERPLPGEREPGAPLHETI